MCAAAGNGRPNAVACRIRSARPQGSGQGWGGKRGSHLGLFMVCWGRLPANVVHNSLCGEGMERESASARP
jgi:hypothetical protein